MTYITSKHLRLFYIIAFVGIVGLWLPSYSVNSGTVYSQTNHANPAIESSATTTTTTDSHKYLRVKELEDGSIRLDLAIRFFTAKTKDKPTVALAGAVHIADTSFYKLLQCYLDSQDLVLFEGVKARGTQADLAVTAAGKVTKTESAIRFVAIILEIHKRETGSYPQTLEQLYNHLKENNPRQAELLLSSMTDGWSNNLVYTNLDENNYTLKSYGADGIAGGTGFAADIKFADQTPLTKAELGDDPGIQARMAKALGLVFQLDAMHFEKPTYRNSDLTIDQVQEQIDAAGGDASALFSILDGSSFIAKFMKVMLKIIEINPRMQAAVKLMLIETLSTVEGDGLSKMPGMPQQMIAMMKVLIENRNQVVIDDLQQILTDLPNNPLESIAIVYGAGHLADMEKRLIEQCDYEHAGVMWIPAITVNLETADLTKQELELMRKILKQLMPTDNN